MNLSTFSGEEDVVCIDVGKEMYDMYTGEDVDVFAHIGLRESFG